VTSKREIATRSFDLATSFEEIATYLGRLATSETDVTQCSFDLATPSEQVATCHAMLITDLRPSRRP